MADYGMYEDKFVGLAGDSSLQWARYEALLARGSEAELLQLCDNKSPVVRSYAFQALVEKRSAKVFDVLVNHIHDVAKFERTVGCFGGPWYVSDFYLEKAGYFPYDSSTYTISAEQRDFLDSLMLFGSEITFRMPHYNKIRLLSRNFMLEHLAPKEAYYKRLREIVRAGALEGLPALAKFHNANDVPVIRALYESEGLIGQRFVFEAIINFPHPDLFPIVAGEVRNELLHDNQFEYKLYKALVLYKTPEARKLLEEALSKFAGNNQRSAIEVIKFLLEKYPDKELDGLLHYISAVNQHSAAER